MPEREERKLVSVLFVDIVGSTARAHGADPDDVRDFLRRFHEPAKRLVEQHGGACFLAAEPVRDVLRPAGSA